MSRLPLGLLVEHLACSVGSIDAHAVPADSAAGVLFDLALSGANYASIPISGDGQHIAVILADRPFTVPRAVEELRSLTQARGALAGTLGRDVAAGLLLSIGHSHAAGPAQLSDGWQRIACGEVEGQTRGVYQTSERTV